MTPQEVQLLLQSISSFAIAGGLVFAAFQFYHVRKAQHVANFTKLVELQMQLRRMRVDDPSLARVYRDDMQGIETDEEVRQYFFNLMQISVYEIVWFSHRQGQIPQDYFHSWEQRMKQIAAEPSFRKVMSSPSMKIMHDDFQAYVMKLLHDTPSMAAPGRRA